MKILKFGGTSIANQLCINNIIDIVKNETKCVVVVSAISGVTNLLNNCMNKAKEGDLKFKLEIDEIFIKHLDIINLFIPKKRKEEIITFTRNELSKAEKLLRGISLVKEITPNIYSKIIVTGEKLSSKLINEIFNDNKLNSRLVDGNDLIYINGDNQNHLIDWGKTRKKVKQLFYQNSFHINVIPGFICKNENGDLSTLGRGGSDLSA